MKVYHGTYKEPDCEIRPHFVSRHIEFAHWFASTAVEENEPYWIVEFEISEHVRTNLCYTNMIWNKVEDTILEEMIKATGWQGMIMIEHDMETIKLFYPDQMLNFIAIHKFIAKN